MRALRLTRDLLPERDFVMRALRLTRDLLPERDFVMRALRPLDPKSGGFSRWSDL